jgi:hypothetical protein
LKDPFKNARVFQRIIFKYQDLSDGAQKLEQVVRTLFSTSRNYVFAFSIFSFCVLQRFAKRGMHKSRDDTSRYRPLQKCYNRNGKNREAR